jgi:hypothetical protein
MKVSYDKTATANQQDAALTRDDSIDTGQSDVPILKTFQSSSRHSDVSPGELSERWGIV